ncbi:MAG: hypothetical protein HY255_06080 [Betaproteobacteria bacterium]|nr:hypothetical protein [Betaproteobacteria bacterium]
MDFFTSSVALAGIVCGVGAPLILIGMILYFKLRKLHVLHDLAITLAEKGQPIPPELFLPPPDSALRTGLILVGLGLGLSVLLWQVSAPWSVGLIPMFTGFGYLISWKIETGRAKDGSAG